VGRVHRGDLGKIICAEAHYPWAGGGSGLASPTPELRLRYWFEWNDLCGDVIVEQDIHALDVATWILDSAPIKARGTKGRKVRLYGDFSDHFAVTYWFPGNVVLTFTSVKAVPGVRDEIRCKVFGSAGVIDTDYFGEVSIRGQKPFEGGQLKNLYNTGTVNNIAEFYCGINGGDYANGTVAPSVRSNLSCILGRTAAGLGQEVTWEEMIKANVRLEPNLRGLTS
jgi:predicted dehydrogenase